MRNLKIEIDLFYDNDLSQIYFDESIKHISGDSYLFTSYDNLSNNFDKEDFFIIDYEKTKKRDVNKLKVLLCNEYNYNDYIRQYELNDLISCYLQISDLDDLETLLNEYNIIYKKAYSNIIITGHSQGDIAQVLTNLKEFKETQGTNFIENDFKDYFTNLFYHSPIGGGIVISFDYTTKGGVNHSFNIEFFHDEFCDDFYNISFDNETIIQIINKQLIQYDLNEDEKNEIIKEVNSLDYTDIKGH